MLGLPASTEVKKALPKNLIYDKFNLKNKQKVKFDEDISRMTLVNEISTKTMAVSEGKDVKSFFVVHVLLKKRDYDDNNIIYISKLIKQNLLFALEYNGKVKIAVFYEKLLCSDWAEPDSLFVKLDGLNLDAIWQNILVQIGNVEIADGNTLAEQIQKDEERQKILKQIERLETKARKEMNPRKKIELVQKARKIMVEMEKL